MGDSDITETIVYFSIPMLLSILCFPYDLFVDKRAPFVLIVLFMFFLPLIIKICGAKYYSTYTIIANNVIFWMSCIFTLFIVVAKIFTVIIRHTNFFA